MKNTKSILLILFYCGTNALLYAQTKAVVHNHQKGDPKTDLGQLSALNAQFIRNFVTSDTVAHGALIHADFICIQGSGAIMNRTDYLNEWAHGFEKSGYEAFDYGDEEIRIFGNTALVRSKTSAVKTVDGKKTNSYTVYTDTYVKEKGRWRCVQAQITPLR
jgi:ketosteroid isomerase-like protein